MVDKPVPGWLFKDVCDEGDLPGAAEEPQSVLASFCWVAVKVVGMLLRMFNWSA